MLFPSALLSRRLWLCRLRLQDLGVESDVFNRLCNLLWADDLRVVLENGTLGEKRYAEALDARNTLERALDGGRASTARHAAHLKGRLAQPWRVVFHLLIVAVQQVLQELLLIRCRIVRGEDLRFEPSVFYYFRNLFRCKNCGIVLYHGALHNQADRDIASSGDALEGAFHC